MIANLSYQDVKRQSQAVFKQFGESKWIPYAQDNVNAINQRPTDELKNCGIGKVLVSVAMGASLEDKIDALTKYRERFDLLCCDKAFGVLVERGITPDFVMLCDCNIPYDPWLKPYIDKTAGVRLISTPYGNTDWTKKWKGPIYFYANRDAIESERHFIPILGENVRTVPASSNVSNAQVVFMTGMDEWNQTNFAGYERIYLVGYDYSWRPDGNYYAFHDPKPKRNYMATRTMLDRNGDIVLTSENLIFSARWLTQFVNSWRLPVFNCSGRGIDGMRTADLEQELSRFDIEASRKIKSFYDDTNQKRLAFNESLSTLRRAREALWHRAIPQK